MALFEKDVKSCLPLSFYHCLVSHRTSYSEHFLFLLQHISFMSDVNYILLKSKFLNICVPIRILCLEHACHKHIGFFHNLSRLVSGNSSRYIWYNIFIKLRETEKVHALWSRKDLSRYEVNDASRGFSFYAYICVLPPAPSGLYLQWKLSRDYRHRHSCEQNGWITEGNICNYFRGGNATARGKCTGMKL